LKLNLDTFWGYGASQAWAMIAEHNAINIFRSNFHEVDPGRLYRSAQPTTFQLRRYIKKYGIKTVINLRRFKGRTTLGALEKRVCDQMGVKMISIKAYSRQMPRPQTLRHFKEVFESIEYPALIHCKSGADRAGIGSALYLHWMKGVDLDKTGQLAFYPFGHIKGGRTGLIDYFIEIYSKQIQKSPSLDLISFSEALDYASIEASFKPKAFSNTVVEYILRRE
jgi:protein tyrosine/serine phosphatase